MNVRYAVVGCCFVGAALLMIVSAHSNGSKNECRDWLARFVANVLIPCVDKVEVQDPLNIGTPMRRDSEAKR